MDLMSIDPNLTIVERYGVDRTYHWLIVFQPLMVIWVGWRWMGRGIVWVDRVCLLPIIVRFWILPFCVVCWIRCLNLLRRIVWVNFRGLDSSWWGWVSCVILLLYCVCIWLYMLLWLTYKSHVILFFISVSWRFDVIWIGANRFCGCINRLIGMPSTTVIKCFICYTFTHN